MANHNYFVTFSILIKMVYWYRLFIALKCIFVSLPQEEDTPGSSYFSDWNYCLLFVYLLTSHLLHVLF